MLRVVRGEPTDDELAALVVALATRPRPADDPAPRPSGWRDHARRLGVARPAPDAWWRSGLPG